jgi:hypothetical protein
MPSAILLKIIRSHVSFCNFVFELYYVYINESLSKGRSSLFYKARQLKKQKLILDTWTRDGNIFVKTLDSTVKVSLFLDLWAGSCLFGFGFCPVLNGLGTEVFGANVIGNWLSREHTLTVLSRANEQEPAHKSNNAVIVTEVQVHSNPEPGTVNNGGEEIELLSSTVINTSDNV